MICTDPRKPIGFRPTTPRGDQHTPIGWRVWAGPFLIARVDERFGWWSSRRAGWSSYGLTVFGVSINWH